MKRIIESELMSDEKQAVAYANANFEEPHEFFVELQPYFLNYKIYNHIFNLLDLENLRGCAVSFF